MNISFSTEPIAAGESRILRVEGAEPIAVQIKCFVNKPPPRSYRPCPECGTFNLRSDEPRMIRASDEAFRRGGGTLVVAINDGTGETVEIKLEVVNWGKPGIGGAKGPPRTQKPGGGDRTEPDREFVKHVEEAKMKMMR